MAEVSFLQSVNTRRRASASREAAMLQGKEFRYLAEPLPAKNLKWHLPCGARAM